MSYAIFGTCVFLGNCNAVRVITNVCKKLALPPNISEAPPKTALGEIAALSAGYCAMKALWWPLKKVQHLMAFKVPSDVTRQGIRGFLRATGPVFGSYSVVFAVIAVSSGIMGFVATKIDVLRLEKS